MKSAYLQYLIAKSERRKTLQTCTNDTDKPAYTGRPQGFVNKKAMGFLDIPATEKVCDGIETLIQRQELATKSVESCGGVQEWVKTFSDYCGYHDGEEIAKTIHTCDKRSPAYLRLQEEYKGDPNFVPAKGDIHFFTYACHKIEEPLGNLNYDVLRDKVKCLSPKTLINMLRYIDSIKEVTRNDERCPAILLPSTQSNSTFDMKCTGCGGSHPETLRRIVKYFTDLNIFVMFDHTHNYYGGVCKKFLYNKKAAKQFTKYCKKNLHLKAPKPTKTTLSQVEQDSSIDYDTLKKDHPKLYDQIKFSPHCRINTEGLSRQEAVQFAQQAILEKYPYVVFGMNNVEAFNIVQPIQQVAKVKVTISNDGKYIQAITHRITNCMCSLKKEDRAIFLSQNHLTLQYDVSSSIPRITRLLNQNVFTLDDDIYKMIYDKFLEYQAIREESKYILENSSSNKIIGRNSYIHHIPHTPIYTQDTRDKLKQIFLRCYFQTLDQAVNSYVVDTLETLTRESISDLLTDLYAAMYDIIGEPIGIEIFAHESSIYSEVSKVLSDLGYTVFNCYDAWYTDNPYNLTQEEFTICIENIINQSVENYLNSFLKG